MYIVINFNFGNTQTEEILIFWTFPLPSSHVDVMSQSPLCNVWMKSLLMLAITTAITFNDELVIGVSEMLLSSFNNPHLT